MIAVRRRERLFVRSSCFTSRGLCTAKRRTLYDTLGVQSSASGDEIRQARTLGGGRIARSARLHLDTSSYVSPRREDGSALRAVNPNSRWRAEPKLEG
jgi:hypothetical protein